MAANEIIWFGDSLVTLYHTIPKYFDIAMMFLLQGFLQTVLGYMRDDNCLLGCFKKCLYKQFFAARNSTVQNQLHTCFMKNWDEKFIFLDDKVRESDSY